MSALGALSMAWVSAEASRPLGWKITGLMLTDGDDWLATAVGPDAGQWAEGRGGYPEQALRRLAEELARLRGLASGCPVLRSRGS
jgi:hypothetical protein